MRFEELKTISGGVVAERVRQALTLEQFDKINLQDLPDYLEDRAELSRRAYQDHLDSAGGRISEQEKMASVLNVLRRRWQEAEELAYLVLLADVAARQRNGSGEDRISVA